MPLHPARPLPCECFHLYGFAIEYLTCPTSSDSDEYIPDVDHAAASPDNAPKVATKAAQPAKASVFPSAKAEEDPGTVPAIPTPASEEPEIEVVEEVVEVEVEETPTPTPTPTAAESHVLRPQDFVIPSVKPTTPQFADYGAWGWKLPHPDPIWKESLGERLCIVDLESRPFDKPGQIWDPQGMSWSRAKDVHGPSGGTLNHWVYCTLFLLPSFIIFRTISNIMHSPDPRLQVLLRQDQHLQGST